MQKILQCKESSYLDFTCDHITCYNHYMETDGINALNPAPDVGGILPPQINAPGPLASYFTRPMVPSPASRRRDTLKGIAQFVPFLGGEIAKYDNDKLGMALSPLDALGPAGTSLKGAAIIGKQAAKKGLGSLDQPKDMLFVHNTNENAIKSFNAMGGIPSPSLAVQPADVPLKGFGDIQLIGKPEKFDPAIDPRNNIYSADAYTPRAPKKIRLAKKGAAEQLAKDYKDILSDKDLMEQIYTGPYTGAIVNDAADSLRNLEKGNLFNPENRIDEVERFFDSNLPKAKYVKETGQNINPFIVNTSGREYKQWLAKEQDKYLSQEGVFQYFDDFEERIVTKPYTLENITNNMIKETQRGGEAASSFYGPARLRALMTEKMTDLPDVKSQRPRIQDNPYPYSLNYNIEKVLETAADEANRFDAIPLEDLITEGDNFTNQIGIYLDDGDTIEQAVKSSINYFNVDPPAGLINKIVDVFKQNAEKSVEYLEAKPMRAVGFDEFAGAIVPPKTSQEVIDILENRGLKVIKNRPVSDFNKTRARQKFKDQMFSFAPVVGAGGIAALSLDANTEDEDKGVGSLEGMAAGGEVPSEKKLAQISKAKIDEIEAELQNILGFRIYDNLFRDGTIDNLYQKYDINKNVKENLSNAIEDEFKITIDIPYKKEISEILKSDDPEKELEKRINIFGTKKINQALDSVNLPINIKKTEKGLKLDKDIYKGDNLKVDFSGYKPDEGDFTGDIDLRYKDSGRFGNIDVQSTLDETGDIDTKAKYNYRRGPFSIKASKLPGRDARGNISYTLKDIDIGQNQKLNFETKLNNLSEAKLALDYSYKNPRTGGFLDAGLGISNMGGPEFNVGFGREF